MGEEFEGDLSESVFWGVDLRRSTFRDVNFTGARMKSVWLVDTDVDGLIDRLVINGVDVTDYVRERDPWQPLRGMLRPTDRAGLLAGWDEIERVWNDTIADVRRLGEEALHRSVNGEFSFVQTLRHLVFASDKWFTVPIDGGTYHAMGLPNTGSQSFPFPGLDLTLDPSLDDVLTVRAEIGERFRRFLEGFDEPQRPVVVDENGAASVIECCYTVFEEEFEHRRYALRDLALLG